MTLPLRNITNQLYYPMGRPSTVHRLPRLRQQCAGQLGDQLRQCPQILFGRGRLRQQLVMMRVVCVPKVSDVIGRLVVVVLFLRMRLVRVRVRMSVTAVAAVRVLVTGCECARKRRAEREFIRQCGLAVRVTHTARVSHAWLTWFTFYCLLLWYWRSPNR